MIVRCNKCVSAFAVNDDKVADKKFAFTCPKCNSENIIDNRKTSIKDQKKPVPTEQEFEDDLSFDGFPDIAEEQSKKQQTAKDELHFEDSTSSEMSEFDEIASEFSLDDIKPEKGAGKKNINLEIEESADFSIPDDEDISFKEEKAEPKLQKDDTFSDSPEFLSEIPADDKPSPSKKSDDFDIELKDDFTVDETDDILFDDFKESSADENKPVTKEKSVVEDDTLFDFDIDEEPESQKPASDRDTKLSSQDDIDALFAEEGISFEEKPISKRSEEAFEDEITVDIDMLGLDSEPSPADKKPAKSAPEDEDITLDIDSLDIDLDEFSSEEDTAKPSSPAREKTKTPVDEEDITLDIDSLDIDLDEETPVEKIAARPASSPAVKTEATADDEDITLDIDSLDIDLDEIAPVEEAAVRSSSSSKEKTGNLSDDEDITLDIDSLDLDLDEVAFVEEVASTPPSSAREKSKSTAEDDDITLDIDSLDIDLDEISPVEEIHPKQAAQTKISKQKESVIPIEEEIDIDIDNIDIDLSDISTDTGLLEKSVPAAEKKLIHKKDILFDEDNEFNEEDIKLNLDDLDIDLDEIEKRELVFEDDVTTPSPKPEKKKDLFADEDDEDESITIDLDTLELDLAEERPPAVAELSEEDEKLTLDDAGLTFDELTVKEKRVIFDEPVDEDMKLTIDEIDPDLTLDRIAKSGVTESRPVTESIEELPEIDLDKFDAVIREEDKNFQLHDDYHSDDEFVIFPEPESGAETSSLRETDMLDFNESENEIISTRKGSTSFSIDLSLKYSRVGAFLRLIGLYLISMIPHFVVMFIYMMLSSILGFINQIVVLSTGRCVEDFALIIENTLRYFFYIKTNVIGIVEDRPVYAGREFLDHPLQMNVTYPIKYSKVFAILRLSVIGIMLITLPHFIVFMLLTVTIPFAYLAGIIAVIISRRWPDVLFMYLTRYFRYLARISSFITGLTDEYPPFKFD